MRYPPNHKAETRKRIVRRAAAEFRARGINGIGVAELMSKAGLTHGGFYAHFESKEALLEAALETALEETRERLRTDFDAAPEDARGKAVMDAYLAAAHRDRPERGCAIVSLGSEVARLSPKLRRHFDVHVDALLHLVAGVDEDAEIEESQREAAMRQLAMMVGALVLSRTVRSKKFSEEILDSARNAEAVVAAPPAKTAAPRAKRRRAA